MQEEAPPLEERFFDLSIDMLCIAHGENEWQTVEAYISHHTHTRFSHGICPTRYENILKAQAGHPKSR